MAKFKPVLVDGFVKPGFEKVSEVFRANLVSGLEKGGTFAAYYKGKLVVNLWGGHADYACRRPWKEDTLSCFFSSTKGVAAFMIAHLVDRGLLSYDEKVCTYWPEFAANGKENVTLKQLVSNQAGLISLSEPFYLAWLKDRPEELSDKLAVQKPYWTPGTAHGYHPLTFGLYLDQVVRRADPKCRSLSDYFREEVAEPYGLDFHIGLPKPLQHRAARAEMITEFDPAQFAQTFQGNMDFLMATRKNPRDFIDPRKVNDPDNRELQIPSTHGHGTAASLAKFYGMLACGGELEGKRFISRETIEKFATPIVAGYDMCFGLDLAWSLGTSLFPVVEGNDTHYIIGHGGYGGQNAGMDLRHKLGFAYTSGFLDPLSSYTGEGDQRTMTLYNALYDCIWKLENISVPRVTYFKYSMYEKAKKDEKAKL